MQAVQTLATPPSYIDSPVRLTPLRVITDRHLFDTAPATLQVNAANKYAATHPALRC